MSADYRYNHYVPVWYQRRFLSPGAHELLYLDLKPESFVDPRGVSHTRRPLTRLGPKRCFAEYDLYTTYFRGKDSTDLEKFFFGTIDTNGHKATDFFRIYEHPDRAMSLPTGDLGVVFDDLIAYMTVQKFRTPKGLAWLAKYTRGDRNETLRQVVRLQRIYGALWGECVWQIADASKSSTKFIVTDHPVTVYNRRCGPRSQWCRDGNDPDIAFHASHTLFALSSEKLLILTNLSWVRNPYQSETGTRPNANPLRTTMFNLTQVQTGRLLAEQEVREINFILKSRASRFIAAPDESWLYPERHVSKSDWAVLGDGYLLMPDPRPIHMGGEILVGHRGGGSSRFDEYGRRPWEPGFQDKDRYRIEQRNLYRFQGEFARRYGPQRRGRAWRDPERDSDDLHAYYLSLDKK